MCVLIQYFIQYVALGKDRQTSVKTAYLLGKFLHDPNVSVSMLEKMFLSKVMMHDA